MKNYKFAAFVMTYERSEIILDTISKILGQTFPPKVILIVDNSHSVLTEKAIQDQEFQNVIYHQVGYNSGPAGAAYYGLKELTRLGYDWIYWGDDDNPPRDHFVFEDLFIGIEKLIQSNFNLGVIGEKGGYFNANTGRIRSLSNNELKKNTYLEVDSIPGGHSMIVNSQVIKDGILPDPKLFFGFEEFDFCLKAKKGGYKLFIDAAKWYKIRALAGNTSIDFQRKNTNLGIDNLVKREYYSTRNLLRIYSSQHLYTSFAVLVIKSLGKMIYGYRFGLKYGSKMFNLQRFALRDFVKHRYGELN
ncbi:glycosyltransferase [Gillisia sp. CAL575]|uniref:glycosyltransferase n=1 Tax=Gillisia sp. CAL575 TaxID=985255 RepID=UPI0003A1379F|nr:glycosyltransferase [Gillisia sp. CAL575]